MKIPDVVSINKILHQKLIETEDYDTLGGFLINQIDCIPSETEPCLIEYENLLLKVECVKDKRIETVKIHMNRI